MTPNVPIGRAVVIVSGGAAVSPFTTPDQGCRTGLAAGNTDTYLREGLLAAGHAVFTSPARIGVGEATEDTGWGGFSDGPPTLPAEMTINAVGDIDEAGKSLARFLTHLHEVYGVSDLDIVAHSMGGLFSRAAIRILKNADSPLTVGTLTTIGTPWEGGFSADYAAGDIPLADCNGDPVCEASMREFAALVAASSEGAGEQVTARYLCGADGWNERQGEVLSGIPVVVIGGDHYSGPGVERVWPNDGLVALGSALADGVSRSVLPHRESHVFPDVHSIYFSHVLGLPWERALTWDPDVLAVVQRAIEHPNDPSVQPHLRTPTTLGEDMAPDDRCHAGDWVEVACVLLEPADRAEGLPPETAEKPLLMWVKGFASADAAMGDVVEVETMTGRRVSGDLSAINPGYYHTFGDPIPELNGVGRDVRTKLAAYRAEVTG